MASGRATTAAVSPPARSPRRLLVLSVLNLNGVTRVADGLWLVIVPFGFRANCGCRNSANQAPVAKMTRGPVRETIFGLEVTQVSTCIIAKPGPTKVFRRNDGHPGPDADRDPVWQLAANCVRGTG